MNDNESDSPTRGPLPLIFAGLLAFGLVVAAGSYFSDETPDWRKPVIVIGALGCFLGGWWMLLRTRRSS